MICPNGHRNADGARFCGVCGAVMAPAERQLTGASYGAPPTTPRWVVPAAVTVGILGMVAIVTAVVLVASDDGTVDAGPGTTVATASTSVVPPTSAPTTAPITAPPTTAPPTTPPPVTAPPTTPPPRPPTTQALPTGDCAADVRSKSGDRQAYVYRSFRTARYDIQICLANGDYWYYGRNRESGKDIALEATYSGGEYRAPYGDTLYTIDSSRLIVYEDGEVILDEAVL